MTNGEGGSPGPQRMSSWPIAAAIVIAGAIVAAALRFPIPRSPATPGTGTPVPPQVPGEIQPRVEVSVDDDPVRGDPNAPVTMIEFSDFECPFCARFFTETLPTIEERYVATGKVRFVYRDFPIPALHAHALKAAEAGGCANEQGKFWELHDTIFENQGAMTVEDLKRYAAELGLNAPTFNTCLDSGKYADEVEADVKAGEVAGVRGTPGFFINGRLVSGAQPTGNFVQIIEEELKKAAEGS